MRQIPTVGDSGLFRAMARCLTSEELCAEWWRHEDDGVTRNVLLDEIVAKQDEPTSEPHQQFAARLFRALVSERPQRRGAYLYALARLCGSLPDDFRQDVLSELAASKRKLDRLSAYKILRRSWRATDDSLIERLWERSPSAELAYAMAKMAPPTVLAERLRDLSACLHGSFAFRTLYLRAAESRPECVDELKAVDGVSYVYVATKLGLVLERAEALQIYEECRNYDDLGLLIWCFGKQGLWEVLQEIAATGNHRMRLMMLAAGDDSPLNPQTLASHT
jgi:hypothetical protein